MRDCERCGKPVDGSSCPYCGFSEAGVKADDSMRLRCADVRQGQRCAEQGTLSPNLRGGNGREPHPGPWYCYRHFPPFLGRDYASAKHPPPQGFEGLKAGLCSHSVSCMRLMLKWETDTVPAWNPGLKWEMA